MEYIDEQLVPTLEYFVERRCSPDWKLEPSHINFFDLTYVYEGKAEYIINGEKYKLEKGDFVFIQKGSLRQAVTFEESPMVCFAFNFQYTTQEEQSAASSFPVCFYEEQSPALRFPACFHIDADMELQMLYRDFANTWIVKEEGYAFKARAQFMLILHRINVDLTRRTIPETEDKRILTVRDYILNHYNQKCCLRTLANLVNLNPVYLGHLFKKQTGCSVIAFTNRIRIHAAEAMLSTGGYSVSGAAYRCGFEDPFYFSKLFKEITGKTPSGFCK